MAEVDPNAFANAFARQIQLGQSMNEARQQNAFNALRIQQMQRQNALASNPNATPEDYIRGGDAQTGVALQSYQDRAQTDKQQAFQRAAAIAQRALTLPDEQSRKGFLQQVLPAYAQDFAALGANVQQGLPQMLAMPDAELQQKLQQFAALAAPEKPLEVSAGASLVTRQPGGGYSASFTAPNLGQEETARHNREMEKLAGQRIAAGASAGALLSDEGLDLAAQEYLNTGKLPAGMGRGAAGTNARIVSKAAEIARANGNDAQAAALNRAAFKSAQTGLTALTKQRTLVGAFERTALKNLEIALEESQKVDRTGVPVLNRWLLAGKKNLAGDVEVGRFNAALTSALNEYAKVLSGSTSAAGISDAARREATELLSTANTPEQVAGIVEIMKREMANREAGFAEQEAQLKETMSGRPAVGVAPAATGAPVAPGAPAGAAMSLDAYLKSKGF